MKVASKLGKNGITTIPQAVVEALGLAPSAEIVFSIEEGGTVTLTGKQETFASLAGSFPKKKRAKPATDEEIREAIQRGATAAFKRSVS